jgi:hypothetical protein
MHMNDGLQSEMLEATRLTRAGRLTEATALLQRALRGGTVPDTGPAGDAGHALAGGGGRIIDLTPDTVELAAPQQSPPGRRRPPASAAGRPHRGHKRFIRTCPRRCAASSIGSNAATPSRNRAG